jgi:hypothetical protein
LWYAYVSNNPVTNVDPTGLGPKELLGGFGMMAQGTLQGLAGTVGAVGCTAGAVALVTDDVSVIGFLDDGLAVAAGAGAAASATFGFYGFRKMVNGTQQVGKELSNTINELVTWMKAKDRRAAEKAKSLEEKHGDSEWQEPASESAGKQATKDATAATGDRSVGREVHDSKAKGEPNRSLEQLKQDVEDAKR